jgi:hypothetical protein
VATQRAESDPAASAKKDPQAQRRLSDTAPPSAANGAALPSRAQFNPGVLRSIQRMAGNRAVATLLVQREADGAQVAITSRADAVAAEAKKQAAEHEGEEPPKPNRADHRTGTRQAAGWLRSARQGVWRESQGG